QASSPSFQSELPVRASSPSFQSELPVNVSARSPRAAESRFGFLKSLPHLVEYESLTVAVVLLHNQFAETVRVAGPARTRPEMRKSASIGVILVRRRHSGAAASFWCGSCGNFALGRACETQNGAVTRHGALAVGVSKAARSRAQARL